jgi:hypothetical protein
MWPSSHAGSNDTDALPTPTRLAVLIADWIAGDGAGYLTHQLSLLLVLYHRKAVQRRVTVIVGSAGVAVPVWNWHLVWRRIGLRWSGPTGASGDEENELEDQHRQLPTEKRCYRQVRISLDVRRVSENLERSPSSMRSPPSRGPLDPVRLRGGPGRRGGDRKGNVARDFQI